MCVIECGDKKDVKIYLYTLKKTCLGVLESRRYVAKTTKTGLKEGGGIEMSIYKCFPYTCMHRSPSLEVLNTHIKRVIPAARAICRVVGT